MTNNFKCGYYINNNFFELPDGTIKDFEYYSKLKQVLHIKKLKNCSLIRIGNKNGDGGYVMADNFVSDNIAYSFGINNEISWDSDMADSGYQIYMYDHTINNLPYQKNEFHFFKEGLSGINHTDKPLKTLKYYIEKNNHQSQKNMILKMDIESYEWNFLETVDTGLLKNFDQIVIELHSLIKSENGDKTIKLLEKLNRTHQLVHLHGNNCGFSLQIGDSLFAEILEATYVNKENYNFTDEEVFLPTEFDCPNDPAIKEINLGYWNHQINNI